MHRSRHSVAQDCTTFAAGHAEHAVPSNFKLSSHCGSNHDHAGHAVPSDFKLSSHCGSNHLPASHSALQLLQRVLCWVTAAVRQAHPHCFNSTGHCVGSVHATTRTSTWACVSVDVKPLCLVNQVGCKCTCSSTAKVCLMWVESQGWANVLSSKCKLATRLQQSTVMTTAPQLLWAESPQSKSSLCREAYLGISICWFYNWCGVTQDWGWVRCTSYSKVYSKVYKLFRSVH